MKVKDPVLYIGGILVKPPSEMTVSKNKLWKQGSGRSRTGNMCGSIQCRKYKLEITWTNLSEDEAMQLSNLLDPDFITVKFIDPKTKSFKTQIVLSRSDLSKNPIHFEAVTYQELT